MLVQKEKIELTSKALYTRTDLMLYEGGTLTQILCFWTSSIVLPFMQNAAFQRLPSVSIFRRNLLRWAQSIDLVPDTTINIK
jgi:hypothetical protein